VLLCPAKLLAQDRLRFTSLIVLFMSTMVLFLIVPDHVGDGAYIANRFLLLSTFFLVLLALSNGIFDARLLTLCSFIAALVVIGFAGEYLIVSMRLAPALDEIRSAMAGIPRHSRILIMGYRMDPSCLRSPLLDTSAPERHWAMAGALKNELIVLNGSQGASSHFPLKDLTPLDLMVTLEISDANKAAWLDLLKSPADVEFIVSWGAPVGVSSCRDFVPLPFGEELKTRYELVFFKQDVSRIALWRRR
jgi:hypothetical protein